MPKFLSFLILFLFLSQPALAKAPKAGDQAPNFSLVSVEGKTVSLSSLKGKVVLIGMFHICVPCMNQAMEFNKVRQQFDPEKLVVLGINTSGDSKKDVLEYLAGFPEQVNFPYLLDPKKLFNKDYVQRDMPTVLIIDREGVIQARIPTVGADQLTSYIKKLF